MYGPRDKSSPSWGQVHSEEADVTEHIHPQVPNKHGHVVYGAWRCGRSVDIKKKKLMLPEKEERRSHMAMPDLNE